MLCNLLLISFPFALCVLIPHKEISRRHVVIGSSAFVLTTPSITKSATWLDSAPPKPVQRDGLVFIPQDGDVSQRSAAEIEKKFGSSFCEYLSRVLLKFDVASSNWWNAQARKCKNSAELASRFDAFVDATKLSLSRRQGETPAELLSNLQAVPEFTASIVATRQLGAAFALIPSPYQPTKQLDDLFTLTENRSVISAELNTFAINTLFTAPDDDEKENYTSTPLAAIEMLKDFNNGGQDVEVFFDPPIFSNKAAATGRLRLTPVLGAGLTAVNNLSDNEQFDEFFSRTQRYRAVDIVIDSGGSGYSSSQSPVFVRLADGKIIAKCQLSTPVLNPLRPIAAVYAKREDSSDQVEVITERMALVVPIIEDSLIREKNAWTFPAARDILFAIQDSQESRRSFAPVEVDAMPTPSQFFKISFCGGICAGLSHGILTPVELAKTKLQIAGNDQKVAIKTLGDAYNRQGPFAFFAGLDAVVLGFFLSGAVGFGGTAYLKTILLSGGIALKFQEDTTAALVNPDLALILAALLASVAATIVVCPFEIARVKAMVHDAARSKAPALLDSWREAVIQNDGNFRSALFGTLDALLVKDIIFAIVKFSAFDKVSDFLYQAYPELQASLASSLVVSLAAGTLAGVGAALASQPLDAAFTRIESNEKSTSDNTTGLLTALRDVYNDKGILDGLYAGAVPRAVFAGTLIALEFVFFEFLKKQLHVAVSDFTFTLDVLSGATAVLPPPSPLS